MTHDDLLAQVVRDAEAQRRAVLQPAAPSAVLAMIREAQDPASAVERTPSFSAATAWATFRRVALAQLRVVHWAVLPTMIVLLGAGSAASVIANVPASSIGILHAQLVLFTVTVVAALCSPGDVRREFLTVTPVSPTVVLGARLAVFFGATFAAAALASVAVTVFGASSVSPAQAIGTWLAPATLLTGVATWAGLWRGPVAAWGIGLVALMVLLPLTQGSVTTLSPAMLAVSAALYAFCLRLAARPDL